MRRGVHRNGAGADAVAVTDSIATSVPKKRRSTSKQQFRMRTRSAQCPGTPMALEESHSIGPARQARQYV